LNTPPSHVRGAVVQEVLETQHMQAATAPVTRDIVLIGGGQSHVGVLHMFATKQIPDARHCRDEVVGIACGSRKVLCRNRPPVTHDASPIKFASTPRPADVAGAARYAAPGKPIRRFNERWLALRTDTQ
jgi:selenide,water dikinase